MRVVRTDLLKQIRFTRVLVCDEQFFRSDCSRSRVPEPPLGVWGGSQPLVGASSPCTAQTNGGTEGSATRAQARAECTDRGVREGGLVQRSFTMAEASGAPRLRPLAPSEGALVTASLSRAPTMRQAERCPGAAGPSLEGGEMMAATLRGAGVAAAAQGREGTCQGHQGRTGAHSEPGPGAQAPEH